MERGRLCWGASGRCALICLRVTIAANCSMLTPAKVTLLEPGASERHRRASLKKKKSEHRRIFRVQNNFLRYSPRTNQNQNLLQICLEVIN